MNLCQCCDTQLRESFDETLRKDVLVMFVSEEIKLIEQRYIKYVSGELECSRQEGAIIINNYNSREKIQQIL
tara:strand:+ start:966 stop:1181 length:216 start_codon:yes stop_codon:yes gene_type:complete